MIALSLAEIAAITGGVVSPGDDAVRVTAAPTVDSRAVLQGSLFVAVAGESVDGHSYAEAAHAAGAAAALVSRPVAVPHVLVADVVVALGALAAEVVRRLKTSRGLRVVAITGSQGKTSVKDLAFQILAPFTDTVAAVGSFNNELGVPLTALRVTEDTAVLVLEMGARGVGHLRTLCAIAPPDVSVVLNVGHAHLGVFGSREAIAAAKGELVEALGPRGVAILNADDPAVAAMATRTAAEVVTFGSDADISVTDVAVGPRGTPTFVLGIEGQQRRVALGLLGGHQAVNATAAAAIASELGIDIDDIVEALGSARVLSSMRLDSVERPDGVVVINDAYNANPDSMASALRTLAAVGATGRTFAVLGEMLELGESSPQQHRAVGTLARSLGIDVVVAVGDGGRPIGDGARGTEDDTVAGLPEVVHVDDVDGAVAALGPRLQRGDVVLVKASRAVGLERVAAALLPD